MRFVFKRDVAGGHRGHVRGAGPGREAGEGDAERGAAGGVLRSGTSPSNIILDCFVTLASRASVSLIWMTHNDFDTASQIDWGEERELGSGEAYPIRSGLVVSFVGRFAASAIMGRRRDSIVCAGERVSIDTSPLP